MRTDQAVSEATRGFLARAHGLLIDGTWVGPGARRLSSVDPADGQELTQIACASRQEVEDAVAAARRSFEERRWLRLASTERARILWRIAELIERESQLLAELETLDAGKLLSDTRNGDVPFAAEVFRYQAGWCTKLEGRQIDVGPDSAAFRCLMVREPVGVAALIVPWNGALTIGSWKIAPALAAGCSIVVKPSEHATLSLLKLGELILEAGVPPGVVNIVTGPGSSVGAALVAHPQVDKISFTGSSRTGRQIVIAAAERFKKLTLELGGKSPVIVCADADLESAAAGIASGIFGGAGEVCVAGSRLYIERSVYPQLLERLALEALKLKLGPGMDPESRMGPLISAAHREHVAGLVRAGIAEGARTVAGGRLREGAGFFYEPTILADCEPQMTPVREEIFGPVLCAMPWDSLDEVVAAANDSQFGLAGSIWTQDLNRATQLTSRIRAGLLWVNAHGVPDPAVPFGGYKASGWGREQGREGIEAFTELKSVMVRR
ncbi:MAG TPA: aldehyde dehydrogenase family protein [Steroidobacteraceae bacterium]|nr:aldehyde dehydrogenase family protein [Steroidobacteraceae bacterium]